MTVTSLLKELSARGVRLQRDDGHIHVRAPRGVVTRELHQALVQHKPELLDILKAKSTRWDPLIPRGWTPTAWHGRLTYLAARSETDHPEGAEKLRAWATAVAKEHQSNMEDGPWS